MSFAFMHFCTNVFVHLDNYMMNVVLRKSDFVPKFLLKRIFSVDKNVQKHFCLPNRLFTRQIILCDTMKFFKRMKIFVQKCMEAKHV